MSKTPPRDSDGRFEAEHSTRNRAGVAIGALLLGGVAAGAGYLIKRLRKPGDGHAVPDLAEGAPRPGADDRAPVAFRPDMHATPTAAEREAMRPVTLAPEPLTTESGGTTAERAPSRSIP